MTFSQLSHIFQTPFKDVHRTFSMLSLNLFMTFSGLIFVTFLGLSQAVCRTFAGLSHNFLRSFSILSYDFLSTSHDFLRSFLDLSPDNKSVALIAEILRECSPPTTCHMSHVACHVSRVMCHMSCVACHMSYVTFFLQCGEAYWWRVCHQWGLPLSSFVICININKYFSFK